MFYYRCNECLKEIDPAWEVVVFPFTGARFHPKCWDKLPVGEKMSIIRFNNRIKEVRNAERG